MWWRDRGYRGRRPSVDRLADPSPLPDDYPGPFRIPLDEVPAFLSGGTGSGKTNPLGALIAERIAAGQGFTLADHDPNTCPMCTFRRQVLGELTPEERIARDAAATPVGQPTVTLSVTGGDGKAMLDFNMTADLPVIQEIVARVLDEL